MGLNWNTFWDYPTFKVPLQSLVNKTVDRILEDSSIKDHVKLLKEQHGPDVKLQLIYKIGLDGSKG